MNKKYFTSTDLSFVAAAILTGNVEIVKVIFHETKPGTKIYFLSPVEEVQKIHLQYISDQIRVSPAQLSTKIAAIKNLQAQMPERNQYGK